MNAEPVTKRGASRMNKRSRPGIAKPSGSTEQDADLQRIGHIFRGYLDNYKYTKGSGSINTHEFWGGEGKSLQSFRGIIMRDFLKKYIFGMLVNTINLECSDDSMSLNVDWIYKNEHAAKIGENGETFTKPEALEDDLFVMFYDILVELNEKTLLGDNGIVTSATIEGNNNLAQDDSIGFGARHPQIDALAGDRDNNITIVMTLAESIIEDIISMEYGQVVDFSEGYGELSSCQILDVPLKFTIQLCEYAQQQLVIYFPKCTVNVTYDGSGTEVVKVTLNLSSLGSEEVNLADGSTEVVTDMYVMLKNKQGEIKAKGA